MDSDSRTEKKNGSGRLRFNSFQLPLRQRLAASGDVQNTSEREMHFISCDQAGLSHAIFTRLCDGVGGKYDRRIGGANVARA